MDQFDLNAEVAATVNPGGTLLIQRDNEGRWTVIVTDAVTGIITVGRGATLEDAWNDEQ
jgi:hypothetical protein